MIGINPLQLIQMRNNPKAFAQSILNSNPNIKGANEIKRALECGKHILCEAPLAITREQSEELHSLADKNGCILMDSIKTAFSIAYQRMVFMAKGGKIGKIVSVDATATSLRDIELIE